MTTTLGQQDPFARHTGLSKQTLKRAARSVVQAQNDFRTTLSYPRGDVNRHEMKARKRFMRQLFRYLNFNQISGDYVEFGCNAALTFRLAYNAGTLTGQARHQWACDSFEGLPEHKNLDAHPEWVPGTMATDLDRFRAMCGRNGMTEGADYTVVPGFYSESLTAPGAVLPEKIAAAYIDCDLYSSTQDVLRFLMPRLRHGMVLALDDYFCFTEDAVAGNRLALAEAFADITDWRLVPYLQYGWNGMSFIVESTSLLASPTPW
ncbi:hypothetical protein GCM10028801_41330 [Nocardioides maradonensis]